MILFLECNLRIKQDSTYAIELFDNYIFFILANLVRHYKEKHPETEPPDHIIAAGEAALKEQQENGTIFNDSDELVIDVSKSYSINRFK